MLSPVHEAVICAFLAAVGCYLSNYFRPEKDDAPEERL